MKITIIAAYSQGRVIGANGTLPWRIKEDLHHFRNTTRGHTCIMGRKTLESLPKGAASLPDRELIVLSTNPNFTAEGATVVHNFADALKAASKAEQVFIIGGSSVYEAAMAIADEMIITYIAEDYDGDTYFPAFSPVNWKRKSAGGTQMAKDVLTGNWVDYRIVTYTRKERSE